MVIKALLMAYSLEDQLLREGDMAIQPCPFLIGVSCESLSRSITYHCMKLRWLELAKERRDGKLISEIVSTTPKPVQ